MSVQKPTLYLCDRKACAECHDYCKHSAKYAHAKNKGKKMKFVLCISKTGVDSYWEFETEEEKNAILQLCE